MTTPTIPISFEFFPPKTPEGQAKLVAVRQTLYALRPQFFSVTYGAGGSTQDGTLQTVQSILADGHDAAPHFSCIGATRSSVREQLALFRAAGIEVVPAPTNFTAMGRSPFVPSDFLPQVSAMQNAYYALHEWLGIAWLALTVEGSAAR